jgi:prophage tail gpP-like protein
MADEYLLRIAGKKYDGWTQVSVKRSIEELAHSFSASLTDRWTPEDDPIPIRAGEQAIVALNGRNVTIGYIDEDVSDYDSTSQSLSISGRSKTGDLIDCAAIHKSGAWTNQGLLKIAKDLCAPFNLRVRTKVDLGNPFPFFSIQDGETVFQAIDRGARMKGVLVLTDGEGGLYFDRTGTVKLRTTLQRGVNIVSGSKRNSWKDRFKNYTVKTQARGTDQYSGEAVTSIKRTTEDKGIDRHRPLIIQAENEDSGRELQKRVDWERNVRAGRSVRVSYTVQGWTHEEGLWEPNKLIHVVDDKFRIDDVMLIVSAEQTRSESGTETKLELCAQEAFTVEPFAPKKERETVGF